MTISFAKSSLLLRLMRWASLGMLVMSAVGMGLILLAPRFPAAEILLSRYGTTPPPGSAPGAWGWVLITHTPSWLLVSFGYWRLALLFGTFAKGLVFDAAVVRNLRLFTVALFLEQLVDLAFAIILGVAYGPDPVHAASAGQMMGGRTTLLFLCGTFTVIARVLEQAVRLKRENERFV